MLKVIVADDNPIIVKALVNRIPWEEMSLELAGVCHNGEELLEQALKHKPHIIVTDIRMPVSDGLQLIGRLRDKEFPVQFVIISGYSDFQYMKKAIEFDVAAYLMKPIQDEELREALVKCIERIARQERIDSISRSVYALEEKERLRRRNRLAQGWLRKPDTHLEPADTLETIRYPAAWMLYALPLDGNYRLPFSDDGRLLELIRALSEDESAAAMVYLPAQTLLAAVIPQVTEDKRSRLEFAMENWLNLEDIHWSAKAVRPVFTSAALKPEFLRAVRELYGDLFNAQFSSIVSVGSARSSDFEALRLHLSIGDFQGGNRWLEEHWDRTLSESPISCQRLDSFVKSTVSLYGDYVPFFRELAEPLDGLALPALAFTGKTNFLDLFRHSFNWEVNENRTASIIAYINSNFTFPLTLDEISKRYHYNAIYLGQLIKRETGMPFNQYLNKLRIDRAMEMLRRNEEIKLADLATQLGFSDVKYFSKVFKKLTGLSPSQYSEQSSLSEP